MSDERVGIESDLVNKYPGDSLSHVDIILKINGKNYIANLISDLSRIKTHRRVNSFCFELNRISYNVSPSADGIRYGKRLLSDVIDTNEDLAIDRRKYLKRLEKHYGKIDFLSREEVEQLDTKLGYSFSSSSVSKEVGRGLYSEDVLDRIRKEFDNPETLKKYVLHGQDVPEGEILKYKLDYIFQNIDRFTEYNSNNINYLENIRYYIYVVKRLLKPYETQKIQSYVATVDGNFDDIISIIRVRPDEENSRAFYYLYSKDEKKYIEKTPEKIRDYLNSFEDKSLKIVGKFDRYNARDVKDLDI